MIEPVVVGTMTLDRVVDNFFAETEQVAFCTQNVIPGIDFTDDPLLQGRNFSLPRHAAQAAGQPELHQDPGERAAGAARCRTTSRTGTCRPPSTSAGAINYEPNGWGEGPREHPLEGYASFPQTVQGEKRRLRPESFDDHYSQARQFYSARRTWSRTTSATRSSFELSKCEMEAVRVRVVSHLLNIDDGLAAGRGRHAGDRELPAPAPAAQPTRVDLAREPGAQHREERPRQLRGPGDRGADLRRGGRGHCWTALEAAAEAEGAKLKFVAPKIGGITDSAGTHHAADEKVDGGPSVLFDAVALVPGEGARPTWRRCRRRATSWPTPSPTPSSSPMRRRPRRCSKAGGIDGMLDGGCVALGGKDAAVSFLKACRELRFWDRERTGAV